MFKAIFRVNCKVCSSKRKDTRFLSVVKCLLYLLFGCIGLIQIDHLTFSKIKFESDPFSGVSSKCVIAVSLMSCCWPDSNSMFMKVGVINQKDII